MIFGLGGHNRRPSRDELEQEAAATIAERVASGRPPPEVWRKAEEWRAANPKAGPSWYSPDGPPPLAEAPVAVVSAALVPRVVRLPAGFLTHDGQVGDDRPVVAALADPLGDPHDREMAGDEHVVEAHEGRHEL
jgi:hypothetical protein